MVRADFFQVDISLALRNEFVNSRQPMWNYVSHFVII